MKHIKSIICIFLVAVLLSGCSFKLASSVNDLVSSLSPFGDNANIQKAMDVYVKNGYSLKTPSKGEYTTSYIFFDIDNDDVQEAITFYEPSDNLGTIYMAIMKKINEEWNVVQSQQGIGEDIYKVDFCDINNDGVTEILVSWDTISNSTNHILAVYLPEKNKDGIKLKKIKTEKSINEYMVVDFDRDGKNELLLFEINSGSSSSAKAQHYMLNGSDFKLLSETKLDSHISTYSNLKIESAEDEIRVYADALGSNGESMLTEIIYSSKMYKSIVSPFYSYSTGVTKGTTRNTLIPSYDVNNDGLIEIPLDKKMKNVSKQVKVIDWKNYKKSTLIHSCYSLYVEQDKYCVVIPDKYLSLISVEFDDKANQLIVKEKDTKAVVFSVMPILKAVYNENDYKDYEIILEDSGYYYLGKSVANEKIKISVDDLKKYIKCIND
ncbi:MAG: hypothetical protein ACI4IL_09105 [Eubacterium sp.]